MIHNQALNRIFFVCVSMYISWNTVAQNKFEPAIKRFEKADSLTAPALGQILFVGSSTLEFWKTFSKDLAGFDVLNRGVGGTQMSDVNELFDRWVLPYKPRMVVLYEGDNDLAAGKSTETIINDYQYFIAKIRTHFPKIPIVIYSIKPSIARENMLAQQQETNKQLQKLCAKQKRMYYIDSFSALMGGNQKPLPDVFIGDNLHLNEKGYIIWAAITRQFLNQYKQL
jgi:lysophospholipase L1-like esterase